MSNQAGFQPSSCRKYLRMSREQEDSPEIHTWPWPGGSRNERADPVIGQPSDTGVGCDSYVTSSSAAVSSGSTDSGSGASRIANARRSGGSSSRIRDAAGNAVWSAISSSQPAPAAGANRPFGADTEMTSPGTARSAHSVAAP